MTQILRHMTVGEVMTVEVAAARVTVEVAVGVVVGLFKTQT